MPNSRLHPLIPSARVRVRVRVPPSETHGAGTRIPGRPLPNAEGVAADSPGLAEERGPPGVHIPNDPRSPKAVRRFRSGSGSLSESESNNPATRCRYRFRPRHRRHGTRARRSASQPLGLTHALTAPSRNAPVLPTRRFGSSSHAASGLASTLFILPILSAAGHGDETPHPNPVDSLRSQSRR